MSHPLVLEGITRRFGAFTAVDGVSLEVRAGEIVGFLGSNGAGKTTALRCACGLIEPDAGSVRIAGCDLAGDPIGARRHMGFVPDRPFLYERLTSRECLAFIAALYAVPPQIAEARVHRLALRLQLREALDQPIETHSFGTRQKVALIAALVHAPALLMLDEPLGGLDPHSARALRDTLREHADTGAGVLVSTHLLDVAERLCDRIVMLRHGRVIASGTLAELRGNRADATLEELFLELTRTPEELA
ncbi:MAG: ABC transporter ATP-binding protein [Candidatus Eisenbacteria bacterium]